MRELHWSPQEKAIARQAFNFALGNELDGTIREAKDRMAKVKEPSELWELEDWLGERRREIDNRYDYRYSVLPQVFATLIREGRLSLSDLEGIGEDKLDYIRSYLKIFRSA
jgi:hypothetical protein